MSKTRPKPLREILKVIEDEGGTDFVLTHGINHWKIRYSFGGQTFQQFAPHGTGLSPRWLKNFRSNVRNSHKEKIS